MALSQNAFHSSKPLYVPFRPTLFLLKLSMASLKTLSDPCVSPETLYSSHSTGTLSEEKTSLTEPVISFPICK